MTLSVTVAMLTFRRPADLAAAVPAVAAQLTALDGPAELLVVDNDPDGSAADQVAELAARYPAGLVRYVHEPTPGISAGRNRALDEAAGHDVIVFIDDDELPETDWLRHLTETYRRTGAAGVVGPVLSAFAAPVPGWVRAGRFFDHRRLPTGAQVPAAATNNLLLDLTAVGDLRFDPAFGLSGGSDTLFTRILAARGGRLVWCDEAVVVDQVPVDRATCAWVLHRAERSGNSHSRVAVVLAGPGVRGLAARIALVGHGVGRVVCGTARSWRGRLTGSAFHDARGQRTAARGRGMIKGALGAVVYDYARS